MSGDERELEVHERLEIAGRSGGDLVRERTETVHRDLEDAIDWASNEDAMTWLLDHGKRIAAIVTVEQAERGLVMDPQLWLLGEELDKAVGALRKSLHPSRFGSVPPVDVVHAAEGAAVVLQAQAHRMRHRAMGRQERNPPMSRT